MFSLDNSNRTDCVRLIESVSQLSDLTNKITLNDDETTRFVCCVHCILYVFFIEAQLMFVLY